MQCTKKRFERRGALVAFGKFRPDILVSDEDAERTRFAGFQSHMAKPFDTSLWSRGCRTCQAPPGKR